MKPGIVICSRSDSKRVPRKVFKKINGLPTIEHLIRRLVDHVNMDVILAIPHKQFDEYRHLSSLGVRIICGSEKDPLSRTLTAANKADLDTIVRVTHDKIFTDTYAIAQALNAFEASGADHRFGLDSLDYLYCSDLIPGSGFEVISKSALEMACTRFKNVEHVGYAIHCVTDKTHDLSGLQTWADGKECRLLLDYENDYKLMELILSTLGNDCTLSDAVGFLHDNPWAREINRLPLVTIYTCAYNAERWINQCMGSVSQQKRFRHYEYVLIDDFSRDSTHYLMNEFAAKYPKNVKVFRNTENLGLASSSNVALTNALGKYIVRLDADDFFIGNGAVNDLVQTIKRDSADIVYPANRYGKWNKVQTGDQQHHIGGALFRTRAANHVKFTDGLRGYEGYDFFERAKDQLKITYHKEPLFFYRQHDGSMSRTHADTRVEIKRLIDENLSSRNRAHVPTVSSLYGDTHSPAYVRR